MMAIDRLNHLRRRAGWHATVLPEDIYRAKPGKPYTGFSGYLNDLDGAFGINTSGAQVGARLARLEAKIIERSPSTYFWLGAG